jgi:hypothetical protein
MPLAQTLPFWPSCLSPVCPPYPPLHLNQRSQWRRSSQVELTTSTPSAEASTSIIKETRSLLGALTSALGDYRTPSLHSHSTTTPEPPSRNASAAFVVPDQIRPPRPAAPAGSEPDRRSPAPIGRSTRDCRRYRRWGCLCRQDKRGGRRLLSVGSVVGGGRRKISQVDSGLANIGEQTEGDQLGWKGVK